MNIQEKADIVESFVTDIACLDDTGRGNMTIIFLGVPRTWTVIVEAEEKDIVGKGSRLFDALLDIRQRSI